MDAGDTAKVFIAVAGATKIVDVYGDANGQYCNFQGVKVC
jgi:hypothetical protein